MMEWIVCLEGCGCFKKEFIIGLFLSDNVILWPVKIKDCELYNSSKPYYLVDMSGISYIRYLMSPSLTKAPDLDPLQLLFSQIQLKEWVILGTYL